MSKRNPLLVSRSLSLIVALAVTAVSLASCRAASSDMADEMIESVSSGACGPCGSTAPTGRSSTGAGPLRNSPTCGDVNSAKWIGRVERRTNSLTGRATLRLLAVERQLPGGLMLASQPRSGNG